MQLIKTLTELQSYRKNLDNFSSIGFVPTMGALHQGHLSLVEQSNKLCDITIVSIFVNPTQFGADEDFSTYPRTLEKDLELLSRYNVNCVFVPNEEIMYPTGFRTWITVEELSDKYCGASRYGHFRGVATIVAKLINLVKPHYMFMGEKDFQQIVILETMLKDLNYSTQIVRCPIIREPDGLAMSSRNQYLNESERKQALCLYHALSLARLLYASGEHDLTLIKAQMTALIEHEGGRIDYIAFVNQNTLEEIDIPDVQTRILIAVYIGSTRLIDNMPIAL